LLLQLLFLILPMLRSGVYERVAFATWGTRSLNRLLRTLVGDDSTWGSKKWARERWDEVAGADALAILDIFLADLAIIFFANSWVDTNCRFAAPPLLIPHSLLSLQLRGSEKTAAA
jgi:hypothetical protein